MPFPSDQIDVAAVVVTYNSERHVEQLLDSLPDAFGSLRYAVVVVDNGSSDGTLALLERRDDVTVVRSANEGFAAGVNLAVRNSPASSSVLVLNPDATLDPDAVPLMLEVQRRTRAGVVAPRVREADGRLSPSLRRRPTLARVGGLSFTGLPVFAERVDDPREYTTEHPVDWVMGAIMLIDRRCYDQLGGLDESYFLYSEETEFCLRAGDAGWPTVYTPKAGAMHVGGGSGENATTHTMQVVNRVRVYRRQSGELRARMYLAGCVAVELRRALLGKRESRVAVRALLHPALRPPQIGASTSLVPM